MQLPNTGIILTKPRPTDYVYGSSNGLLLGSSVKNWFEHIPVYERQIGVYFDTMACVTFSALNTLEVLYKFKYGIDINFSDRYTAKKSGTTRQGNYLYKVGDSIRKDGFVEQDIWDFDYYQTEPREVWEDYYSDIPKEVDDLAQELLEHHEVSYEWVTSDLFSEAIQGAPIQVIVKAWYADSDGLYYSPSDKGYNHAVVLLGYEDGCPVILDHYEPFIKKLTPSYDFHTYGMRYDIKRKNMSNVKLVNVEGSSAVGFFVPARDESALLSLAENYGKRVPMTSDGGVDWVKTSKSIEGTVKLK